jgi:predicted RecB family nuclease
LLVVIENVELCIVGICVEEHRAREVGVELVEEVLKAKVELIGHVVGALIALATCAELQGSLVRDATDEGHIDDDELPGTEPI